jgi:tetratricopeptide (TPR) repeat protein
VLAAEQQQRAYELLRAAPPSRGKARVLATIGTALTNMSRFTEALEVGREALALARPLGMRRTEAAALAVVGMSRAVLGDRDGIADARRSVAALEEQRAAMTPAAYGMLGAVLSYLGDLAGMTQALEDTRRTVARFESRAMLVWTDAVRVGELYWWGRWDEAAEAADRQIGRFGHGAGRYVEVWCRCLRGKVRLARGDAEGALDDAVAALEIARHADEHTLFPAAAFRAYLLTLGLGTVGDEVKGRPQEDLARLVDDLRGRLSGHLVPPFTGVELAEVLAARDTPPSAVPDRLAAASLWLGALRSYLAGAHVQAADTYVRIGSRPDEAFARLRAGERMLARGQVEEATAQLTRARDFYQPLGATRYLERIEALLAGREDG